MFEKSLRNYIALFIVISCLWIAGCSQTEPQDKNIDIVKTVLEHEFNVPNEEVTAILDNLDDFDDFNRYTADTFKPHFTQRGYEKFTNTAFALMYHVAAHKYDFQLTTTQIDVKQNEVTPTNYNFTVYMDYVKKDGESKKIEMPGTAIFREDGIEQITYKGSKDLMRDMIEYRQQDTGAVDSSAVVVESNHFVITHRQYMDYKESLMFIHQMNEIPFILTDEEIINRMIEREVLIQYARNQQFVVTKDEIEAYALQTKEAVEQSEMADIHKIHLDLAKKLNVSLENYFTHPKVLKEYENILMTNQVIDQLIDEGTLTETFTIANFAEELRKEDRYSTSINQQALTENK